MRFSVVILFLLVFLTGKSQSIELKFSEEQFLKENEIRFKANVTNEVEARKEIRKVWLQLLSKGYYSASIDSTRMQGNHMNVFLFPGERIEWTTLRQGNAEEDALIWAGYREKLFRKTVFTAEQVGRLFERLIVFYENRGYPFASVKLDSIEIDKKSISGSIRVTKNKMYRIDSVLIKGDARINEIYLQHWINIRPGDLYREELLSKVDVRIREIPFVEATQSSEVLFTENQCLLILYLKKKRSSQFNGIAGVLSDNRTGKITISGDARLRVRNGFGRGELIDMNWRKLGVQVQDLRLNYDHPFLFKSNFGTDLLFKLYKQDSTFLELRQIIGLQYRLRNGNNFRMFLSNHSTDLLSPKMFANAQVLPTFADVRTLQYGLSIRTEKLDYRLNPRKGYAVFIQAGAGRRSIKKNPVLPDDLYANVSLNTSLYSGLAETDWYIPVLRRSTIKISNRTSFIESKNLFQNELNRIGGIHTLRGFNEESLFASAYSIFSLEYRYLLDANSAVFVFTDGAWYERDLESGYFKDKPYGFGAGVFFQTKAGVFSFTYALGSEQGNPVLLRASKVHFGFVNYF